MEKSDRSEYMKQYRATYKKRVKSVMVSLPMDDFRRLEKAAKSQKKKPSAYFRELGLAQLDQQLLQSTELEDRLREHNLLIRNIANNLNQLARSGNIFRDVDRSVVFDHLKSLDDQVRRFSGKS